jgi:hypothetical protein
MKKVLTFVAVAAASLSFVACGNEQTGSGEKAEKYCSSCGANNLETSAFCGSCGASLNGDNSAVSTPTIQAIAKPTATPEPTVTPTPKPTPKPTPTPIAITELSVYSLDKQQKMCTNQTISLAEDITIYPSNAEDKKLSWKSSNTSVATVDQSGNVTGKAGGTAKITVTSSNGVSTFFDISVYNVKLPSTPLQLTYNHKYNGVLKANITKLSQTVDSHGDVKVTFEGEMVVVDMVDRYLYFLAEVTDPDGYVYTATCALINLPETPGAKFKKEIVLFRDSSFGGSELTPGNYTVVFKERNIN